MVGESGLREFLSALVPVYIADDGETYEASSVFASLRAERRRRRPPATSPLSRLHQSSREAVAGFLEEDAPSPLDSRPHRAAVLTHLLVSPARVDQGNGFAILSSAFFDCGMRHGFYVMLDCQFSDVTKGPAAIVGVALRGTGMLDPGEVTTVEMLALALEEALDATSRGERPRRSEVWIGTPPGLRRPAVTAARLAGYAVDFVEDLPRTTQGVPAPSSSCERLVVVGHAEGLEARLLSHHPPLILDSNAPIDTYRATLSASVLSDFAVAHARANADCETTAARHLRKEHPPTSVGTRLVKFQWEWSWHIARPGGRADERGFNLAALERDILWDPERPTLPRVDSNRERVVRREPVWIADCPASDTMPDGCRLVMGWTKDEDGNDRPVVLGIGIRPRPDGRRLIHTLYDPSEHPGSWNSRYTGGTAEGFSRGDFPPGTFFYDQTD